jgi:hypothetical protein
MGISRQGRDFKAGRVGEKIVLNHLNMPKERYAKDDSNYCL